MIAVIVFRALEHLSGDSVEVVEVPSSFKARSGEQLIGGVKLGRKLGSGLQA